MFQNWAYVGAISFQPCYYDRGSRRMAYFPVHQPEMEAVGASATP